MLEDELRDTFAAKAGSAPPGSLASLDGFADAAIRGAARVRRRRRAAVSGLAGVIAVAAGSVAVLHTFTGGAPSGPSAPPGPVAQESPSQRPATGNTPTAPVTPSDMREFTGIGPSAEAAVKVRLQLPAKSTVTAAYQAKDGYLVVNTQPDGDKQLVLQQDDSEQQQVLVDDATNITVAKDTSTVAWASKGSMNVGTRSDEKTKKITGVKSVPVADGTEPVTFVGTNLVVSNEDKGFDVWHTDRGYSPTWDTTVVRVFGGTQDNSGVYAEVKSAAAGETAMCLALLQFDQPFKVKSKACGLPVAAKDGARISPDGHWLAYPVVGLKQVAILDLTTVFLTTNANASAAATTRAKLWNLTVTAKTVWLNAKTFVVDTGKKFLKLDPTGKADLTQPLDQDQDQDQGTDGVVLIEPLTEQ
ncbi:hypothetical protein [Dactylosporangium matsuzakiense]|uniref:Uncharacterized protein n=1 Tax=Dactylosporangium matsuzakiense TaxID=53360 RepID=A0A9W6NJW5_9ACTN|nr:hypothetical protein [Dactylosporangium matsuzakiense]UWZ45647.1 hypothetical protein Dmats_03755 [Dactylosporangium matsuzakiense]GLL00340.1 hypothetical protein GCM10017581_020800 [Dactylosporangium matsuzakiense]